MKAMLIFLVLATSHKVLAHIEKGTWRGEVSESAHCFMDVGETLFINNIANPLNERIEIKIGQTQYQVRHPYQMDVETGTISVNHDFFEDVVPTSTGAFALQIKVAHAPTYDAPESLVVMEHDWQTGFKEVVTCKNFKKVY